MRDEPRPIATPSQTVGPFFHFGLATNDALGKIAGPDTPGERIRVRVRVLDGDSEPVPDALVEVYQADASGAYRQVPFTGFGRLPTQDDGTCLFETIVPGPVRPGTGDVQAPHINVCLLARGLLRQVYTRMYFIGHALNAADPLLALVPSERHQTLMATPAPGERGLWDFTIRLQGDAETVFFDV
jgi:protocatechuate 3,4-dioxygenase alpha subunit